MPKGFFLSMDAILALLVVLALLATARAAPSENFTQLAVLQKQHDLFKAWQERNVFSFEQMKKETEWVFPSNRFELHMQNQSFEKRVLALVTNQSVVSARIWISEEETISAILKVYY